MKDSHWIRNTTCLKPIQIIKFDFTRTLLSASIKVIIRDFLTKITVFFFLLRDVDMQLTSNFTVIKTMNEVRMFKYWLGD